MNQRELLHTSLRIGEISNDGYLMFDSSNPNHAQQRPRSPNTKLKTDVPVGENYKGCLYLKSFQYRNNELSFTKASILLSQILADLENGITREPIFAQ
jgi:hypothetical protein